MAQKVILHLSLNSFFVNIEQQIKPSLKNKPFAITKPENSNQFIAVSHNAKLLGITEKTSLQVARKIYPRIVTVPANIQKYFMTSERIISLCVTMTHLIELASINEIYMDITHIVKAEGGTDNIVQKLQKNIQDEIGNEITVNIGVSYNKLLAKLATISTNDKRNAITELNRSNIWEIYQKITIRELPYVKQDVLEKLNALEIKTLLELRDTPYEKLISEFGIVEATHLKNIGLGIDLNHVIPYAKKLLQTNNASKFWMQKIKDFIKQPLVIGLGAYQIGKHVMPHYYINLTNFLTLKVHFFKNNVSHAIDRKIAKERIKKEKKRVQNKRMIKKHIFITKRKKSSKIPNRLITQPKLTKLF